MSALSMIVAATIAVGAFQSPFVGTWKLNPAKSQFTGTTMSFEQLPSGEMRTTAEGQSYTFRTDGKEYPTPWGAVAAWKQVDPATWEATYKLKNAVMSTDRMTLSPDGKTLTVTSSGTRPDGSSFSNTAVFQRIDGSTGLAGRWRSTKVTISSPETMEFAPATGEGLTWRVPGYKINFDLRFDGKDHAVQGPTVPPNFTIAARSTGPRSFELTQKISGKAVYSGSYTVSADGKTLTAVYTPEGTNEKITAVYDRQ